MHIYEKIQIKHIKIEYQNLTKTFISSQTQEIEIESEINEIIFKNNIKIINLGDVHNNINSIVMCCKSYRIDYDRTFGYGRYKNLFEKNLTILIRFLHFRTTTKIRKAQHWGLLKA